MRNKLLSYERANDVIMGRRPRKTMKITPGMPKVATIQDVVEVVCTIIGFPIKELYQRKRTMPIPMIRDFCFYFGYKYTKSTHAVLASHFDPDFRHTISLYGQTVVKNLIDTNKNVKELCNQIDQIFKDANFIEFKEKKAEKYRGTWAFQANRRLQAAV
jgi:chromosomal replication initiation ATPase DnaA